MTTRIEGGVTFDLDEPHYAAIGRVANEWAHFEFTVDRLIWALMRADDKKNLAACVTSQLPSIVRRFDALAALVAEYPESDDALTKKINRLAERANKVAKMRNRIVHDSWAKSLATGEHVRLQVTADKKLDFTHKPVATKEVWRRSEEIRDLRKDFAALSNEILKQLGFVRAPRA